MRMASLRIGGPVLKLLRARLVIALCSVLGASMPAMGGGIHSFSSL